MSTATISPRQLATTIVVAASDSMETWRASWDDTLARYLICDGTADQVEIQAAIDVVTAAGGGRVVLLDGHYDLSDSIVMKYGVILEGQSRWGTCIRTTANSVTLIAASAAGRAAIRNLFLSGEKATYTGVIGINLNGFDGLLENIEVADCDSYGIYTTGAGAWIDWHAVKVVGSNTDGIHLENAWAQTMRGILVGLNGGNGLDMAAGGENFLSGIVADENAGIGIWLHGEARDQLTNFWCGGNTDTGLRLDTCNEMNICNGVLFGNYDGAADQAQSWLMNVQRSSFVNLTIKYYTNKQFGFYIPEDLIDCTFVGNVFDLNGGYAFDMRNPTTKTRTGNILVGNIFKDAVICRWYPAEADYTDIGIKYTEQQVEVFMDILAASTNHCGSWVGTGVEQEIVAGITQPDVPRNLTVSCTNNAAPSGDVIIEGTDAKGDTRRETFTIVPGGMATGNRAFAVITKITIPATVDGASADTVSVGIGSKLGLGNIIYATADVYKVKKNTADWPAASYTVNATYDTVDVSTGGAIIAGDDFTIYYRSNLNIVS